MGLISFRRTGKRALNSSVETTKEKRTKMNVDSIDVDCISELPEPVLHQILSLLHPKDAARTCILSKRWAEVWKSYQILDFDLRRIHKMKKASQRNYKNMINQLLKYRKEQSLNIFRFRLRFAIAKELLNDVEGWIAAVIERKVSVLEIQAKSTKSCHFCLPSSVLSGNSITALNLLGCILPLSGVHVNLPHLQKLSLKRMNIPVKFIQAVFSSSPLIDELRLIGCFGFKRLIIGSQNKLKRLDVHKCDGLRSIVVENPGLESFWFFYDKRKVCHINLSACRALKDLVLEYPRMKDEDFVGTGDFPMLEKLVLSRCYGLQNIEVSGVKLKKLVIRRCRKLVQVQVGAPNLVSLEYHGQKMPFSFLTPPKLKEALFYFEVPSPAKTEWKAEEATRLQEFFHDLDRLMGLKLLTWNQQEAVMYEDMRVVYQPLQNVKKSYYVKLSASYNDLLTEALKAWPYPSTLSVKSHCDKLPEEIYKTLNEGKEEPKCCSYFKNKCWRHYLKSISFEKWQLKVLPESPEHVTCEKTVFSLNWRIDKHGHKKAKPQ